MHGHQVKLVQKARMNKRIINEPPPYRIGRDVFELSLEILSVPNPMLVESGLPDFSGKLRSHFMRKSTLDALRATLDGLIRGRGQKDVQMFRHNGEAMQVIASLIPIVEERFDQQLGIRGSDEQRAPLIRRSRERVSFHARLRKAYLVRAVGWGFIPGTRMQQNVRGL